VLETHDLKPINPLIDQIHPQTNSYDHGRSKNYRIKERNLSSRREWM